MFSGSHKFFEYLHICIYSNMFIGGMNREGGGSEVNIKNLNICIFLNIQIYELVAWTMRRGVRSWHQNFQYMHICRYSNIQIFAYMWIFKYLFDIYRR